MAGNAVSPKPSVAATLSRNSAISLARVMVNSLVALVLPAYLTHRLPVAVYAAWVLILQLAAYVSYLDFGVQTAVVKFVAEFEARGDNLAAGRYATAGLAIMSLCGALGCALSGILAGESLKQRKCSIFGTVVADNQFVRKKALAQNALQLGHEEALAVKGAERDREGVTGGLRRIHGRCCIQKGICTYHSQG